MKRVMGGDFKNLEYVCSSCFTDIGEAAYKVLSNPNVSPEEASLEAKKYLEEDALAEEKALEEMIASAVETNDWSDIPLEVIRRNAANIILTTAFSVAGQEIEREIEIITAECVFGMNLFRDFFAGVRDIVGGRSAATQKVLRDARSTALTELRREALMVGGDAVIAVDLDYSEFSGGTKNGMLIIIASGTAVKLKGK